MMEPKQGIYWKKMESSLSSDRMSVYAADGASHEVAMARYLWNIALCESLYAPLQMFEVGFRNAIDRSMLEIVGEVNWYDRIELTPWGYDQVGHVKKKIAKSGRTVCCGRVIAELSLGFWVSMFENHYEQPGAYFLPLGIKRTFRSLPKSGHHRKKIKAQLERVRALRNRVFHHERIAHWKDLSHQHETLIQMIGWISSDLKELTQMVDSFSDVHRNGIQPFLDQLRQLNEAN